MAETASGIWYPGKTELVSPLEVNFSTMASSIQAVFDSKYTMQYLTAEADIKALPEGTPFYMVPWKLSGVKTEAAGTLGYRTFYTGKTISTTNFNGYSGGGLVPGAAAILISAPKITNYTIPYRAKCEVTIALKITGICAGNMYLKSKSGLVRDMRWHSYGESGLYSVNGSLEVDLPPGPAEFFISGYSDSPSQTATTVLTVSAALTVSI